MTSLFLSLGLVLTPLTAPTPKGQAADSPATKAKAALDEVTSVVFENKTVPEVVEYLKGKTRIEVVLDRANFPGFVDPENEVKLSVNARDVPLREGIESAFAPMGMKVGVVGGTIFISTEDGLITKQMRQTVSVSTGSTMDILNKLKTKTGANIVVDPRLKKAISEANCELDLSNVTLETAVRLTAEVSGYRALRMGNVLFVTSNDRAKELRADADGPTQPGNGSNTGLPFLDGFRGGAGGVVPALPLNPANPVPPANPDR